MKILVFNENDKSRLVVGQLMKELSFNVLLVDTQEKLMEELKSDFLDIVLLDVNSFSSFPKVIDQILKIKGDSYVLLSIEKGDKFSKIDALLKGVDDYIYNDYRLEEISAKVKAIVSGKIIKII